jgi:methyl coenzyme M reductase subunit C-like uncharacterized protein (methanogenesis marker protein 7)
VCIACAAAFFRQVQDVGRGAESLQRTTGLQTVAVLAANLGGGETMKACVIDLAITIDCAIALATETRARYGERIQRAKCIEEMDELRAELLELMGYPLQVDGPDGAFIQKNVVNEGADVIVTVISAVLTAFPETEQLNAVRVLSKQILYKVNRTRERMKKEVTK